MPDLSDGIDKLMMVPHGMKDGLGEVNDNMPKLLDGVNQLRDGASELRGGLQTASEWCTGASLFKDANGNVKQNRRSSCTEKWSRKHESISS